MKMWEPTECPGTEELKDRLQTAREKLARQQMLLEREEADKRKSQYFRCAFDRFSG